MKNVLYILALILTTLGGCVLIHFGYTINSFPPTIAGWFLVVFPVLCVISGLLEAYIEEVERNKEPKKKQNKISYLK